MTPSILAEREALAAACANHPDDALHRLALADWYEEQGVLEDEWRSRPSWLRLNGYWEIDDADFLRWRVLFHMTWFRVCVADTFWVWCADCYASATLRWPLAGHGKQWFCRPCYEKRIEDGSIPS